MTNYGIKITRDGRDVSSNDPADFLHWSKYNNPKTYIVGTASFTITDEAFSQANHSSFHTLTHNLGYIPYAIFYWSRDGSDYSGGFWLASQGIPHICSEVIDFEITTTQLKIHYKYNNSGLGDGVTGLGGANFNFKYYLFIEQGRP